MQSLNSSKELLCPETGKLHYLSGTHLLLTITLNRNQINFEDKEYFMTILA